MKPRAVCRYAALVSSIAVLLAPAAATAHLMPARQGTVNVVGSGAFIVLSVPVSALHGVDDDGDGLLSMIELGRHQATLRAEIDARLVVSDGDRTGTTRALDLVLSPPHEQAAESAAEIVVLKHAELEGPPRDLRIRCDLFGRASQLTITATRRVGGSVETEVAILTGAAPTHRFFQPLGRALLQYVRTGAEHVLCGGDHLLFLLTILVAGLGWRAWLGVITAFTLAHSVTLAAALLGYVRVSPRVVEPLIALSIVVMAADNLLRRSPDRRHRVLLVAVCGLLHGLGFASAMDVLGLDRVHRITCLVGFNLGVELGQALFLSGALVVIFGLRRVAPELVERRLTQAVSIGAVAVGCCWIVQRVSL